MSNDIAACSKYVSWQVTLHGHEDCVGRIDKPKDKSIGILEEGFNPIKFFSNIKGCMKL